MFCYNQVTYFMKEGIELQKRIENDRFSVVAPDKIKYGKLIDPVFTQLPLQQDQEPNVHGFSSLMKTDTNPTAYNQRSTIPFSDCILLIGPVVKSKVLLNETYFIRKVKTNNAPILHRIRFRNFILNKYIGYSHSNQNLQPGDEIVFSKDELYSITMENDFWTVKADSRQEIRIPMATRPNEDGFNTATSDSETATTTLIENERSVSRDEQNDVTDRTNRQHTTQAEIDAIQSENERKNFPSATIENLSSRPHQRNVDVNGPAAARQVAKCIPNENSASPRKNNGQKVIKNYDANNSINPGGDITVPGISDSGRIDADTHTSPRGGKYNLRPNLNPNYSEKSRS